MDEQQFFQFWLTIVSLGLAGLGVVVWYFARKVMELPMTYATKQDVKDAADDWKSEVRQMREERRQDNQNTQSKLDSINNTVTGIHRRIDAVLLSRGKE